jgi:hypothetical protein
VITSFNSLSNKHVGDFSSIIDAATEGGAKTVVAMEMQNRAIEEIFTEKGLKPDQFVLVWFSGMNGVEILASLRNAGFSNISAVSDDSSILRQDFSTQIKCWFSTSAMTHLPEGMYSFVVRIVGGDLSKSRLVEITDEMVRLADDGGFIALLLQNGVNDQKSVSGVNLSVSEISAHYSELIGEFGADSIYIVGSSIFLLRKVIRRDSKAIPLSEVNIVCPFLGKKDGLGEYTAMLSTRFQSRNVKVNLYRSFENVNFSIPTVLEYERNMEIDLPAASNIVVECHSIPVDVSLSRNLEGKILLLRQNVETMELYRGNISQRAATMFYIFRNDPLRHTITFSRIALRRLAGVLGRLPVTRYRFTKYYLMPHINYSDKLKGASERPVEDGDNLCIGTFGFAAPYKRIEKICKLSSRLGVRAKILLSISDTNDNYVRRTSRHAKRISRRCYSPDADVEIGYFTREELEGKLGQCSHLIFAQVNIIQSSGSMRFGPLLGIPVISTDCFQAVDAQTYIVDKLENISKEYLEKTRIPSRPADGFHYLYAVLSRLNSIKN